MRSVRSLGWPASIAILGLVVPVLLGMGAAMPGRIFAEDERLPPGGASPRGSGPINLGAFVRVVDGRSIDAVINGSRVAIGVLGVDVPQGNTSCGRQATDALKSLARAARGQGGLRLVEDPNEYLDVEGRRLYYVEEQDGRPLADELVRAGVAKADGKGKDKDRLKQLEDDARANGRGCLWGGRAVGSSDAPAGTSDVALEPAADAASLSLRIDALQIDAASDRMSTVALAAPAVAPVAAPAAAVPSGFVDEVVVGGLTDPTALAFLPDGRILVAQKHGLVRVIKNGAVLPTPLIDLSSRVNDYWDRGLLGIATHPSFAQNGYLYLLYTYENDATQYDGPKTSRLTRVMVAGDTAALSSEAVILGKTVGAGCPADSPTDPIKVSSADCIPSDYFSHSIGSVRFASDGALFVGTGDAANFNTVDDLALRSQRLDSLAGKLLRVDESGAGVAGNPYYQATAPSANKSKVYASGLRNPFRFNLRPGTTTPYVGDVGWNSYEEINVAPGGANFGWPCYEGPARQGGYEPKATCQSLYSQGAGAVKGALVTWDHAAGGASVTGGAFYTGTAFPAQYQGAYFYADYARGFLRYLNVDANNALVGGQTDFGTASNPVAIEMGPDGSLYYVAIFTNELHRVRYGAAVPPPPPPAGTQYLSDLAWTSMTNGWGPAEKDMSNGETAAGDGVQLRLNGQSYAKGLGVHANSDVRYALGGTCTQFTADVGVDDEIGDAGSVVFQVWADGAKLWDSGPMTGASATTPAAVNVTGKQQLQLVVTDGGNGGGYDHADWAGARVACGSTSGNTPPRATISTPASTLTYAVGDTIAFSGSAADDQDGAVPAARLDWKVLIHHCPGGQTCHTHALFPQTGVASGSFLAPDEADENYLELVLTATDSGGLTGTASVSLQPRTVGVTIATNPAGLQVVYGGVTYTAPTTRTAIVGSKRTIGVSSPQGGRTFQSWSDNGAQQHDITINTSTTTYTANFGAVSDTTPPTVTGMSPANGAKNVATAAVVTATFSEPMDQATLTTTTVTLVQQGTTTPLPATVSYDEATRTVTLRPTARLAASRTTYTATVKGGVGGVKDAAGNLLAADKTWSFFTVNR